MSECIVRFQKRWVDEIKRIGCAGCPIKFQSCLLKEHDKEPCPILRVLPESHGRLMDVDADLTHDTVIAGIDHCANNKGCGGGELCGYCDYGRFDPDVIKVLDKVLKDAEVAMKKQIPIKPMMACGHTTEPWMNYCPRCGQALDWTKEDQK